MKRVIQIFAEGIEYKYEGLACAVLDCKRYQDPFGGIANHDVYSEFVPQVTMKGRRALGIILTKMILDDPENAKLQLLEKRIWDANGQDDAISIIDEAVDIYEGVEA